MTTTTRKRKEKEEGREGSIIIQIIPTQKEEQGIERNNRKGKEHEHEKTNKKRGWKHWRRNRNRNNISTAALSYIVLHIR